MKPHPILIVSQNINESSARGLQAAGYHVIRAANPDHYRLLSPPHTPLMCRIFGHRFVMEEMINDHKRNAIVFVHRDRSHCARCGAPNPAIPPLKLP